MNYEKLYFAFIEKYKNQEFGEGTYTEVHHIIPRHAGGDDSKENLIRLDYKQHVFAHRLLWKAYNKSSDYCAWLMMSAQESDSKLANLKAIGKMNVVSGHLERIRPLANNEAQRAHASSLTQSRILSGEHYINIKKGNEAWRGCNHTDEWKEEKSIQMKEWSEKDENYQQLIDMHKKALAVRQENAKEFNDFVILNAERNEEFLQEVSSRSKNKFISPEGLEFDSPIFAAKYYGNVDYCTIENWCKRKQHGWSRQPKAA